MNFHRDQIEPAGDPRATVSLSADQIRALILLIDAYGAPGSPSDSTLAAARVILRDALRPPEGNPHA